MTSKHARVIALETEMQQVQSDLTEIKNDITTIKTTLSRIERNLGEIFGDKFVTKDSLISRTQTINVALVSAIIGATIAGLTAYFTH